MKTSPHTTRSARSSPIRLLLLLQLLLAAGAAALGACSTTEGFGEDVKHLGGNIEDSAARNK